MIEFSKFKKKKKKLIIVTNVASKWKLAEDSYKLFVDLYEKYSKKGLEIIAFPCGEFMNQEFEFSE